MPQRTLLRYRPKTGLVKRKRKKSFNRKKVLEMLAVMERESTAGTSEEKNISRPINSESTASVGGVADGHLQQQMSPPTPENACNVQDFLTSGRTGRRNALPDILGQHAFVTSSDLSTRMEGLTTTDKPDQPGTSHR